MSTPLDREEELFSQAAEMPLNEREAFLRQACGDDAEMLQRLRALLSVHESQGDMLDENTGLPVAPGIEFEADGLGEADLIDRQLGRYRLLERLGEGGVGVVYRAEQREPIHRFVALKVVKPGMDTREVIQRFESERQALALMEHPGIARVIDAGATAEGRPYFVMELVGGREITRYCDEERLKISQRLRLFMKVCDAVQHAHQKGVIHRDLKPSNVLVAPNDQGEPAPKIIDFGIAKALAEGSGWEKHVTQVAQLIGTPAYMSPEQAAGAPGLDTRSDVYSLGVILYELLAGRLPYDDRRLGRGGVEELRRRIREEDAARPSLAVQSLTQAAAAKVAAARQTTSPRLMSELKGELDWVALRCLEKDPSRRYATALDLAEEIRRHLENEPVRAVAPSRLYRLGKSIRRNRAVYAAGLVVLLSLLTATSVSLLQATRARRAEAIAKQRAEAEALARAEAEAAGRRAELAAATSAGLSDFLRNDLLAQASPDQQPDRNVTLRTVVDRAATRLEGRLEDQPLIRSAVQETLADTYRALGDYAAMRGQAERVYETRRKLLGADHVDTLRAAVMLYDSLPIAEKLSPKESLGADTLERLTRTVGADHPLTLELRSFYHKIQYRGRYREAEPLLRAVKDDALRVLGPRSPVTLTAMSDYAIVLAELERHDEAAEVARQTIDFKDKVYGPDHPQTMPTMTTLAVILSKLERHAEARQLAEHVWEVRRRVLGPEHPQTLITAAILGGVFVRAHMTAEAEALLPQLQQDLERVIGPEHPGTLNVGLLRATLAFEAGDWEEATVLIEPVREALNRRFGPGYADALEATRLLARIAVARGDWAAAVALLQPALEAARTAVGPNAAVTLAVQEELERALAANGEAPAPVMN